MQGSVSQKGGAGVLVGVGAALALVVFLVFQSATPGLFLATRTTTVTETTESTVIPASIPLYKVTFNDTGGSCGGVFYVSPWSVTIGNITLAQPSNATLPLSGQESESPAYYSISTIIFTVPNGSYNYNVISGGLIRPFSGTVSVNGSDISVQLFVLNCYGA